MQIMQPLSGLQSAPPPQFGYPSLTLIGAAIEPAAYLPKWQVFLKLVGCLDERRPRVQRLDQFSKRLSH